MNENFAGRVDLFDQETKPFRGIVTKAVAKLQLERFLPDIFTQQNSVTDGLFSGDHIYISAADERQIRYSFNHCVFGEITYPLIELLIHHQHLVQMHSEEGIYSKNDLMTPMLIGVGENVPIKDTTYKYGGWSVRLQMSSPIAYQNEPQMLQIQWRGKEKQGASDTLEMGYMDMYGNGQQMVLDLQEQMLTLPHLHEKLAFSGVVNLTDLQAHQPFMFDQIAVSDSLVGIAFHGNEQNKIPNQKILLPASMHVLYAR